MLRKQWSESWFELNNAKQDDASECGLAALKDGRLQMTFVVLRCVAYPIEWFEKLLRCEYHKRSMRVQYPTTIGKRSRSSTSVAGSAQTWTKTEKGKVMDGFSDESDHTTEESDSSDSDYMDEFGDI